MAKRRARLAELTDDPPPMGGPDPAAVAPWLAAAVEHGVTGPVAPHRNQLREAMSLRINDLSMKTMPGTFAAMA